MSKVLNKSRIRREKQRFFINGVEIFGVQNVDMSFTSNIQPVKHIGMNGSVKVFPDGEQFGQVSVSSLMVSEDPFISFTGENPINGILLSDIAVTGENYGFSSGYMTSYGTSCSIGSIPTFNASFSVFGNIGKLVENDGVANDFNLITSANGQYNYKIVGSDSIELSFDDSTNRVLSYDLNISIPRRPIYILGSRTPKFVKRNTPFEINATFQIDVDNYEPYNMRDYPCSERVENFSLKLKDYRSNEIIQSFVFNQMLLTAQTRGINVNGNATMNLTYRSYLNT